MKPVKGRKCKKENVLHPYCDGEFSRNENAPFRNDEMHIRVTKRGHEARTRLPETESNTCTYGTKKISYVHAYIERRKMEECENQKYVNHRERGWKKYLAIENSRGGPVATPK